MRRPAGHRARSSSHRLALATSIIVATACGGSTSGVGGAGDGTIEATADDSISDDSISSAPADPTSNAPSDCLVRLHGKGGSGGDTVESSSGDRTFQIIAPTGNADGWGARQWLYFPDDRYAEARTVVSEATADCERIVLNGFSNGAAFVAKLYCRGESFDGRLIGVVIDDPVTDEGTAGCAPPPDSEVALYWTGALAEQGPIGVDCADIDWTCDGSTLVGIDQYAARLGAEITPSPYGDHTWYVDAPETVTWFAG